MSHVGRVGEKYRCSICNNLIEVLEVGGGELICCGKQMDLEVDLLLDNIIEEEKNGNA